MTYVRVCVCVFSARFLRAILIHSRDHSNQLMSWFHCHRLIVSSVNLTHNEMRRISFLRSKMRSSNLGRWISIDMLVFKTD